MIAFTTDLRARLQEQLGAHDRR
ncbi:MAG: hypothetical protein QOD44_3205, partial [Solirubrobacteraceae bacterium]|nr:hypothetical protein [Solirubrobacteraceae bacterium]